MKKRFLFTTAKPFLQNLQGGRRHDRIFMSNPITCKKVSTRTEILLKN